MPVVKVKVKDGAPPFALVFPRRVELEGGEHSWEWDEVQVVDSAIDDAGFGLATRNTESLNWRALSSPVLLPFLGRQTEVGSATEADIMSRILHGSFDVVPFGKLHCPPGHQWVYNGVFLESVRCSTAAASSSAAVAGCDGVLMEVACCSPDHPGEWHGLWEPCRVLAESAAAYDVEIAGDGQRCDGVPKRFVRESREAVHLPPETPIVQAPPPALTSSAPASATAAAATTGAAAALAGAADRWHGQRARGRGHPAAKGRALGGLLERTAGERPPPRRRSSPPS